MQNMKSLRNRAFIFGLLLIMLTGGWLLLATALNQADVDNSIALQAPDFVQVARAEGNATTGFLEEEAGIAAYFQAPSAVNLNDVRDVFRTIEAETSQYIVGSVAVDGYLDEVEDMHVYIHSDGWFLGYYLKEDSAGKLIDWGRYSGGNLVTKFETVLTQIAAEAGITSPTLAYYHFQYPNSTNIAVAAAIVDTGSEGSFQINLPSDYTYYERSWSAGCNRSVGYGADIYFNDLKIADYSCSTGGYASHSGRIDTVDMLPEQFHTFRARGPNNVVGYGTVIVYREGS